MTRQGEPRIGERRPTAPSHKAERAADVHMNLHVAYDQLREIGHREDSEMMQDLLDVVIEKRQQLVPADERRLDIWYEPDPSWYAPEPCVGGPADGRSVVSRERQLEMLTIDMLSPGPDALNFRRHFYRQSYFVVSEDGAEKCLRYWRYEQLSEAAALARLMAGYRGCGERQQLVRLAELLRQLQRYVITDRARMEARAILELAENLVAEMIENIKKAPVG